LAYGAPIDLSTIADANNPTGGFVINGEIKYDYSGFSVSNPLTSPALETERPLQSFVSSPLITKPPRELLAAIVLRLMPKW
jgi:hypothetical protein